MTARDEGAGAMEDVVRDISGETVLGYRVAAYRETHPEHGDKYGHRYSEHWSTPNSRNPAVRVERLFTERQLRAALSTGQEVTSPADGSQVEPSTTGAGRHIPLEPNPFIQWNGGENPMPGTWLEVKFRNGKTEQFSSNALEWDWTGIGGQLLDYDIIAYRIIPTDGGEADA